MGWRCANYEISIFVSPCPCTRTEGSVTILSWDRNVTTTFSWWLKFWRCTVAWMAMPLTTTKLYLTHLSFLRTLIICRERNQTVINNVERTIKNTGTPLLYYLDGNSRTERIQWQVWQLRAGRGRGLLRFQFLPFLHFKYSALELWVLR